ncbi:MAG: hypothetical protein OHK0022_49140 [Roseiflexaceae bacterium]
MKLDDLQAGMQASLELLEQQEALLQEGAYLGDRYARWCLALFAEVRNKRLELERLIQYSDQVNELYDK